MERVLFPSSMSGIGSLDTLLKIDTFLGVWRRVDTMPIPDSPKQLRDDTFAARAHLVGHAMRAKLGEAFTDQVIVDTAKLVVFHLGPIDTADSKPAPTVDTPVVLLPPETTCSVCASALKLVKVGSNRHRSDSERDKPYFYVFGATGPIRPGFEFKKVCGKCQVEHRYQEIVTRALLRRHRPSLLIQMLPSTSIPPPRNLF